MASCLLPRYSLHLRSCAGRQWFLVNLEFGESEVQRNRCIVVCGTAIALFVLSVPWKE